LKAMLKMYHKQTHAGNTPDFWEENWEASQFEESLKFCAIDPLRPLFEKYSKEGSLMLEGGCGLGQYLAYYASKNRRVVGLDFAQQALKNLHKRQDYLNLCGGDVSNLPFADETFDLYYSGGVVEHFEDGAEKSLAEAARVLKKDGVLLISVPYYSPLRRVLSHFKKDQWQKVTKSETDVKTVYDDKKLFQYAYRPPEFQKMLADAGLKIVEKQGYAVIWGLYELPLLNPTDKSEFADISKPVKKKEISAVDITPLVNDSPVSLLKRLVVSEDSSIPVLGLGVKFMRWSSANMMMYVCKK
jgi:ubiquinone/menaquinone biosynthesis C-methylase UbiE